MEIGVWTVVVAAMDLREVMVLKAHAELLEEGIDGDDSLVGQIGEVERLCWIAQG